MDLLKSQLEFRNVSQDKRPKEVVCNCRVVRSGVSMCVFVLKKNHCMESSISPQR